MLIRLPVETCGQISTGLHDAEALVIQETVTDEYSLDTASHGIAKQQLCLVSLKGKRMILESRTQVAVWTADLTSISVILMSVSV